MTDTDVAGLKASLKLAEEALQRCERLAVANRYAGAVMHEVNNPLEALGNLVFWRKRELVIRISFRCAWSKQNVSWND